MPFLNDKTPADRSKGASTNMHPRPNGDYILAPDDILEGLGNFIFLDGKNPRGFRLGQPEAPDARHVYIGLTPDTTSRQTRTPLPIDRPSHLVNYSLTESQPPPTASSPYVAKIPRPDAPTLKALAASTSGYTASTPLSPDWLAWAYFVNGKLTPAGPPVQFTLDNGQSYKAPLPPSVPEGIHHVALLQSEPGTSRPTRPGPMRVQRVIDLRTHLSDHYEMTGPYRWDGEIAPSSNQTELETPYMALIDRYAKGSTACRVGRYYARITWTDANGESLPSAFDSTKYVDVPLDNGYTIRDKDGKITMPAGRGTVWIGRPNAPANATGWKAYVYLQPPAGIEAGYSGGYRRVYDKVNGRGDSTPYPLSVTSVGTQGWSGTESIYGNNDQFILIDTQLPEANSSGVKPPESAPPKPTPFGLSRPSEGTLYARVTEVVRGVESLPSDAVALTINSDQILSVVFSNPENLVPNPSFVETNPERLPLYWGIDKTNTTVKVEDQKLVMATAGSQTGATGSAATDMVKVIPTKEARVEGRYNISPPESGTTAGSAQVVLRQFTESGSITDTVLVSKPDPGEHNYQFTINPAGGTGIAWASTTTHAQIIHRFAGTTKNLILSIIESILRPFRIRPRPPSPPGPPKPGQPPVVVIPPTTPPPRTVVQDPPEPPWSPETFAVNHPDRPRQQAAALETQTFESGLPAGYTKTEAGTATATTAAAAAIEGSFGLLCKKSVAGAAGSTSRGYLQKTFAPATGQAKRLWSGSYVRNRLAVWPTDGEISMHDLCRVSDGKPIAWLEASSAAEIAELVIERNSLQAGSVSINLNGTVTNISVNAAKEVADLSITSNMTTAGNVTIALDGINYSVQGGSSKQSFKFEVKSKPSTGGYVYMGVGGETRKIYARSSSYLYTVTKETTAEDIRKAGYTGYTVTRSGAILTFEANDAGPRSAPSFDPGTTGTQYNINSLVSGSPDTAAGLASRIRGHEFPGWILTQGSSTSVVRFTAVAAGPKLDATYSPGTTGANGSFTIITQGTLDTPDTLAARIRATVISGWTLSQGATAASVIFTATTAGVRQKGSYNPNDTGCSGTMRTIKQGSNAAIVARVEDASGKRRSRTIMAGLSTTTIFNTDITVSGAGTQRGTVHVWGSLEAAGLTLLARFPDMDLTGYDNIGTNRFGVTWESASSLTWELHADTARPSERGLNYFREHDIKGNWLNQVHGYYRPTQPVRQDLFLQPDERKEKEPWAVIPGATYTLAAWIRVDNPTSLPARPLVITAHGHDPSMTYELGDITNTTGLTGNNPWAEYKITVTIPENCHAITLSSKDIGPGEFVIQEIVHSPGPVPLRTGLYKTSGTYESTFDIRTPKARAGYTFWKRTRLILGAITDTSPAGTSITVDYRSAPSSTIDPSLPDTALWSAYYTDPALVPENSFVQARFTVTGPGDTTPSITSGSPYTEYVLKIEAAKRMSTLLLSDRSELPGGAAFQKLSGKSSRPPEGRRQLPSGQLVDDPKLFAPVGHLPPCKLIVFTDEAREHLENNWKDEYVIELQGRWACTILWRGELNFERDTRTVFEDEDGNRYAVWIADAPAAQITKTTRIP